MQLARYLQRENQNARDVANWCGVTASIAYRWIAGTLIPRSKHLQIIARKTKGEVTPNDFHKIKSQSREEQA